MNPTFFCFVLFIQTFYWRPLCHFVEKNGDENLLQKTCSIGTDIMTPLNNPYAWGLFFITIHYPPYYLFKALNECISVICVQSLKFGLQTIIQTWSLLLMDFWQVPWSLLVMKSVRIHLLDMRLCMQVVWLDKIIKCFVACPRCGLIA